MKNQPKLSETMFGALLVTSSVAIGCGHEEMKPVVTPTTTSAPAATLSPASPGKTNSTVFLSDALRKACGISTIENVKAAPKFDFDQNAILPEDRDVLAQVAQCLTIGPLKGRSVKLVGRADPRGTPEYNLALGERRSNALVKYLAGLGVGAGQLRETSRGALDATGSDEAAWRQDRRVDVDVLDATP